MEKEVEELETQVKAQEEELAKPSVFGNPDLLAIETEKYNHLKRLLEEKTLKWEQLVNESEGLI